MAVASGDLVLDLDGIHAFARALESISGQWMGTTNILDYSDHLAGDTDLQGDLDDFSAAWVKAAAIVDSYINSLAMMADSCVAKFTQVDHDLAGATPAQSRSRVRAEI